MPLKIRWTQKEYFGTGLILLGACGLFQVFIIFIAQYLLSIGNYVVIILLPIGVSIVLFYVSTIIFDSYAQIKRRAKIKHQFKKGKSGRLGIRRILDSDIVKPVLIIIVIFTPLFFIFYFISQIWFNNIISFIIAENVGTIVCVFVSNIIERRYARVQRYWTLILNIVIE